jgi:hypothetical protein
MTASDLPSANVGGDIRINFNLVSQTALPSERKNSSKDFLLSLQDVPSEKQGVEVTLVPGQKPPNRLQLPYFFGHGTFKIEWF